ncbi:DUF3499 domain-containing protein [Naumannella halotolerans]|uniref:Uncharacterized protein DUF3499 n=1 Tax=Naumannella halotolerans TaxID=993414 RepID=A0A4V6Q2E4_9ACTN|nr:DUF3499 domain-containing protein [Naumannella halotolerans]TDT34098.1 uncharacterized protein DUF3499 [Naumannella halotolerans]
MARRRCTRTGCAGWAVATLTYVYAESTAVLGPLALRAEPGCYDLCQQHSSALSVPRGWEVIRLPDDTEEREQARVDDLLALADAVREAGRSYEDPLAEAIHPGRSGMVEVARKAHLTVLAEPAEDPPGEDRNR